MRYYKENKELIKKLIYYEQQYNCSYAVPNSVEECFSPEVPPINVAPLLLPIKHEDITREDIINLWVRAGMREMFKK